MPRDVSNLDRAKALAALVSKRRLSMSEALRDLQALISKFSPEQVAQLDAILGPELHCASLPNPGPQTQAYVCKADLLLYGGAAGDGKTDLLLGVTPTEHHRSDGAHHRPCERSVHLRRKCRAASANRALRRSTLQLLTRWEHRGTGSAAEWLTPHEGNQPLVWHERPDRLRSVPKRSEVRGISQ
jgi:hypothetical protein